MNKTKRYIAAELVSNSSLNLVHAGHDMWRATDVFREGLTPKEIVLIEKKREELMKTQMLLSEIAHRVRQSGRCT